MVEISVYSSIKLWPIVSYDRRRYFESTDNILSHKLDNILVFDGGEGFSFYPFAKIVGGNNNFFKAGAIGNGLTISNPH